MTNLEKILWSFENWAHGQQRIAAAADWSDDNQLSFQSSSSVTVCR